MASNSTAVTETTNGDPRANTFRDLLARSENQIKTALPKHLDAQRMIRIAMTAIQRTPMLLECAPITVLSCVMSAAELGLELTGHLGHAYLIPRWNSKLGAQECTFQIGYRGFISLAFRSGQVSYFNAHEVRAQDHFNYEYGTDQRLTHRPAMKERGDIIGFYSVFRLKDGSSDFCFMSHDEMQAHRKRYAPKNPVWSDNYEAMGRKTVIRQLAKFAPISVELNEAASKDEYTEAGISALDFSNAPQLTAPTTGERTEQLRSRLTNGNGGNKPPAQDVIPEGREVIDERTGEVTIEPAGAIHAPGTEQRTQAPQGKPEPTKPAPPKASGRDPQEIAEEFRQRIKASRGVTHHQRITEDLHAARGHLGDELFWTLGHENDDACQALVARVNAPVTRKTP